MAAEAVVLPRPGSLPSDNSFQMKALSWMQRLAGGIFRNALWPYPYIFLVAVLSSSGGRPVANPVFRHVKEWRDAFGSSR